MLKEDSNMPMDKEKFRGFQNSRGSVLAYVNFTIICSVFSISESITSYAAPFSYYKYLTFLCFSLLLPLGCCLCLIKHYLANGNCDEPNDLVDNPPKWPLKYFGEFVNSINIVLWGTNKASLTSVMYLVEDSFSDLLSITLGMVVINRSVSGYSDAGYHHNPAIGSPHGSCSSHDAVCGFIPCGITALTLIVPLCNKVLLKGVSWEASIRSIIIAVSMITYAIVATASWTSLQFLCLYTPIVFMLMHMLKIEKMEMFMLTESLHQTMEENEKMAEEMRLNEMKMMIGNIAHDLKTPLTAFISGLDEISNLGTRFRSKLKQFLLKSKLSLSKSSGSAKETTASHILRLLDKFQVAADSILNDIETSIDTSKSINSFMLMSINRCIDFTKVRHGVNLKPKMETVCLSEGIAIPLKCISDMQAAIEVEMWPIDSAICTHVITDRQWLQENLLCLVSNAVKYSSKGKVTVKVFLWTDESKATDAGSSPRFADIAVSSPQVRNVTSPLTVMHTLGVDSPPTSGLYSSNRVVHSDDRMTPPVVIRNSTTSSIKMIRPLEIINEDVSFSNPASPILNTATSEWAAAAALSAGDCGSPYYYYYSPSARPGSDQDSSSNGSHFFDVNYSKKTRSGSLDVTKSLNGRNGGLDSPAIRMSQRRRGSNLSTTSAASLRSDPHDEISNIRNSLSSKGARTLSGKGLHRAKTMNLTLPHVTMAAATHVRIEVEDQGIGIPPEDMESLFTPFKQAQRLAGGTGLGLFSLAKRIESLHGYFGAEPRSHGKQGTRFWFTFPYQPDKVMAKHFKPHNPSSLSPTPVDSARCRDSERKIAFHAGSSFGLNSSVTANPSNNRPISPIKSEPISESECEEEEHEFKDSDKILLAQMLARKSAKTVTSLSPPSLEAVVTFDENTTIGTHQTALTSTDENLSSDIEKDNVKGEECEESSGEYEMDDDDDDEDDDDESAKMDPMNILIVDDSMPIRKVLMSMLKGQGHTVVTAVHGAQALEKLKEQKEKNNGKPFDVILMDMQMPVMDGLEATRRIRADEADKFHDKQAQLLEAVGVIEDCNFYPSGKSIHSSGNAVYAYDENYQNILALSANSDDDTISKALAVGVDAFMPKPFTIKVLYEKLFLIREARNQVRDRDSRDLHK